MMLINNVSSEQVDALILDLADQDCDSQKFAKHAYYVVRRKDGEPIRSGEQVVLIAWLEIPNYLFRGGKAPSSWCNTIVGASTAVEVPTLSQSPDTDMEFSMVSRDGRPQFDLVQSIYANGTIGQATVDKFLKFLRHSNAEPGARVVFNSAGGSLSEGMRLGFVIREAGLLTDVGMRVASTATTDTLEGECYSACAIAYLGGSFRLLQPGSKIGVHRFSTGTPVEDPLDSAQILTGRILSYLETMGVDAGFLAQSTQAGPDEINILSIDDLRSLKVVTGSLREQTWQLKTEKGRITLQGEKIDVRGDNLLTFGCNRKLNALTGAAVVPFSSHQISVKVLQSTVHYGYFVDEDLQPIDKAASSLSLKVDKNTIHASWTISPKDLALLLKATKSIGFAIQTVDQRLFSGFQIKLGQGKQLLHDYANDCVN